MAILPVRAGFRLACREAGTHAHSSLTEPHPKRAVPPFIEGIHIRLPTTLQSCRVIERFFQVPNSCCGGYCLLLPVGPSMGLLFISTHECKRAHEPDHHCLPPWRGSKQFWKPLELQLLYSKTARYTDDPAHTAFSYKPFSSFQVPDARAPSGAPSATVLNSMLRCVDSVGVALGQRALLRVPVADHLAAASRLHSQRLLLLSARGTVADMLDSLSLCVRVAHERVGL